MNCSHPYGDFSYNSTCEFRCHQGFEQRGAGMLQCLPSQEWSANIPTCTGRAWQGLGGLRNATLILWGDQPCVPSAIQARVAVPLPIVEASPDAVYRVGFPKEAAVGRAAVSCEALFCLALSVPMLAALNPSQIPVPRVHQMQGQDGVLAPLSTLWHCLSPLAHPNLSLEGVWHLEKEKRVAAVPQPGEGCIPAGVGQLEQE